MSRSRPSSEVDDDFDLGQAPPDQTDGVTMAKIVVHAPESVAAGEAAELAAQVTADAHVGDILTGSDGKQFRVARIEVVTPKAPSPSLRGWQGGSCAEIRHLSIAQQQPLIA
jgi:hypothetical protein